MSFTIRYYSGHGKLDFIGVIRAASADDALTFACAALPAEHHHGKLCA